jgi:prephenate dehydrogenase
MRAQAVGIIGVGLIGGSIGLAALRTGYPVFLYDAVDSSSFLAPGFARAVVCKTLRELVAHSDLIIVATPLSAIAEIAGSLAEIVTDRQVVSDVASVKEPVAEIFRRTLTGRCEYIPTHPMAGSERSGAEAARADLFEGAVTILCSELSDKTTAVQLVTEFWEDLGARVSISSVKEHDRIVAAVSHLPHLIAALLVNNASDMGFDSLSFSGPGFRDTTRVASGSPQLWAEILCSNSESIREQLINFKALLDKTLALLDAKDMKQLQSLLREAKESRDRFFS